MIRSAVNKISELRRFSERNFFIVSQTNFPFIQFQIPFPAVSFCTQSMLNDSYERFVSVLTTNNATYPFSLHRCTGRYDCTQVVYHWTFLNVYMQYSISLNSVWIDKYRVDSKMKISQYGWCNTFNSAGVMKMYRVNKTAKYFGSIEAWKVLSVQNDKLKMLEIRPPLFTTRKNKGFRGTVIQGINPLFPCKDYFEICDDENKQTRVVIHSPYEMLDPRHRSFLMNTKEVYKITVLPQIKVTDETLLELDVDEYET